MPSTADSKKVHAKEDVRKLFWDMVGTTVEIGNYDYHGTRGK